jgi:hypothetical protein
MIASVLHAIPKQVVDSYAKKNHLSIHEADRLFAVLESFLREPLEGKPTIEIDEAWHEFILHTKLYEQYCMEEFGKFIHHDPEPPSATSSLSADRLAHCNMPPCVKRCGASY